MIVASVILVTIILGTIMPKKSLKIYFFLAALFISSLYFIYVPEKEFDLFRHYITMDYFEQYSILQILFGKDFKFVNPLAALYLSEYPIYCVIARMVQKTGIKELLPVITGAISYGVPIYILIKSYKNQKVEKWKIIVSYSFIVLNIDFLSISGIRNILATSLFALILYMDLVEKRNKVICFIGYFGICLIHSMGVLLLLLRIMLIIYNKKSNIKHINLIYLFVFFSIQQIAMFITKSISSGNIIYRAASSFLSYMEGGSEKSFAVQGITAVIYLLCFFICIYFGKYVISEKYQKWYQYLIISFLFIVSTGIGSVDIFMRYGLILYILMVPVLLEILRKIFGRTMFSIKLGFSKTKMQLGIYIGIIIYAEMLISFILNIILRYNPINNGFHI